MTFKNRVFGAAIVKAVNSNYNADFTGQPRTLPDGRVYATDKAFKYTIKNYILDNYSQENVFYFKRLKKDEKSGELNPFDLVEAYNEMFNPNSVKSDKHETIAMNLLKCIDIRLFGATFAPKGEGAKGKNISIHGPVQINHGVNIWCENNIYTEQIMSPFRNPGKEGEKEKGASTLGSQSKLQEGHYLHHFSINPKNLEDIVELAGADVKNLSVDDINILKEAMKRGATYYDSASKAGTENELLIWVQLKVNSKIVLPNFSSVIKMKSEKENGKVILDLTDLEKVLKQFENDLEGIEIFRNEASIDIINLPEGAKVFNL